MNSQQNVEIWKPITGYEGRYEISNMGRVKSFKKTKGQPFRIRNTSGKSGRYAGVNITGHDGKTKRWPIHTLVAQEFIGPRPKGMHINHKSGNRRDNNLENLEYCTPSANLKHAYRIGLASHVGSNHNNAKLNEEKVCDIRKLVRSGFRQSEVAQMYGVNRTTVVGICTGKHWTHVPMVQEAK